MFRFLLHLFELVLLNNYPTIRRYTVCGTGSAVKHITKKRVSDNETQRLKEIKAVNEV
jgi:hypothetical protein